MNRALVGIAIAGGMLGSLAAQQSQDSQPIFRVTVVEKSTVAISYRHRSGWTKVDLHGTPLAPESSGHADVNSRPGYIEAKTDMKHLQAAWRYGPEYLTYVLWAITPEGRAKNLGEVVLNNDGDSHLDVTTDLQAFALIVTAEPYFGVTQPSDVVVMENVLRDDTQGKVEQTSVKYDLLKRGAYVMNVAPGVFKPIPIDPKTPLQLLEAQNAVEISQLAGAQNFATDTYQKSVDLLHQAEAYQLRNAGSKPVIMTAREAVQTAETGRLLALKRAEDEQIAREKQAAADRQAAAEAQAATDRNAADQSRLQADASAQQAARDRAAADQARSQADQARAQAELARTQAQQDRTAAEQARAEALAQGQAANQARAEAQEADRARVTAEQAQQQLRQQLLTQLNTILETRDTARGLIVNISDVLFDFGKYTLRQGAREKLAKVAGIVLAHPGLKLETDGYTDSIGTDAFNMRLSEQRADSVRAYLVEQGVDPGNVTAKGFGKGSPVATNDTDAGRQQNRRVEMVVSGDIIGTPIATIP
jgi:outer membrane protein OmpA-like peptidoglycan-associated protein